MNFFTRASRSHAEMLETVIGAGTNLRGTLQSDGGVRVDGVFEGVIETAGNLVVGPHARVVAQITARNVTVAGAVKGNVDANGRLEILSTGAVYGDVTVETVMIDQGGQFQGVSRMRGLSHPALAAPVDDLPAQSAPPHLAEVDVVLDTQHVEATARHVPDNRTSSASRRATDNSVKVARPSGGAGNSRSNAHSAASSRGNGAEPVIDFDLDGLDLDIEPIIPDDEPQNRAAAAKSQTPRRRSSR